MTDLLIGPGRAGSGAAPGAPAPAPPAPARRASPAPASHGRPASARRGWSALAARIDAATPPDRDRAMDGLRALAILGVVLGHWLVMALAVGGDGGLRVTSPLRVLPALAPVSWVLQMLGLFFLVGGHASARSLARAAARGRSYPAWLGDRLVRLARPVIAATAVLGAALPLLTFAGVPAATLRTTATLVVQPLWFIAIYAVVTALTPVAVAATRRLGAAPAVAALALVGAVDLLRYGPWQQAVPGWLSLVNLVPGWSFGFLLGVAWAQGRITRGSAALLAAGGLALAVALVLWFGYPVSLVGVPGAGRTNAHPPSLLVLAVAAAQCGLAILLRDRLARLLRRPGPWAAVALANLGAMTIFCWHQIASMLLAGGVLALVPAGLPGLHTAPAGLAWVGYRLAWLPAYAAVLGLVVLAARRFDRRWRAPLPARVVALLLAGGFAVFAAGVA
jgi:peptidoglycan/LPS O-acetylase OafA/YrhL